MDRIVVAFANEEAQQKYKSVMPLRVTLCLSVKELDENATGPENSERDEGEFFIEDITDCHGDAVERTAIDIRLQTLPRDEGFWLDTGVIFA